MRNYTHVHMPFYIFRIFTEYPSPIYVSSCNSVVNSGTTPIAEFRDSLNSPFNITVSLKQLRS